MKNRMESRLYAEDMASARAAVDLSALKGSSILITGASGLIGSAVVDLLAGTETTIYAAGRNLERLQMRFEGYPNVRYVAYDAAAMCAPDLPAADYLIHGASNADPKAIMAHPVNTMLANIAGTYHLLQHAKNSGAKRVLLISSSEVYGKKESADAFSENEYGFVDVLDARSCYPMGKRAAETLSVSYAAEFGVDCVIARPGHIYGPTAKTDDSRISSDFAYRAARGEALMLKSAGMQLRSYCYCVDCASAILYTLLRGDSGEAYNISNRDSIITIREMAGILARAGGVSVVAGEPSAAEKRAFNPMMNSSLNSSKLEALGWRGRFDAQTGLCHTVEILRELMEQEQKQPR